jgi:WD40 repeat protein
MAKLFVSYSRKDSVVARKLIEAFRSINQDVWVDWESIPPAVDWLEQIFRGIEEADAFIFLISPDSIASEVCKVEIGRAAQNNKRIIPIVLRDVHPNITPESIRKLNWTFIRETDNFEEGLAKVKTAIELDLDWLEEHRRLQVRALEWHRKKDISLLLHGRDLRNARHMIETATSKDPASTDLQKTYIQHSLRSERNRTIAWIATAAAVIVMAVLSYTAWQQSILARQNEALANDKAVEAQLNAEEANRQRIEADAARQDAEDARALAVENEITAEAQRSAARAQIFQNRPGELYTSTLLAVDSMRRDPSEEAEEILRRNIRLLPLPVAQHSQTGRINALAFSHEGNTFATASADGTVCAWRIQETVSNLFCTPPDQPSVSAVTFSPDDALIAMGNQSGLIQILDAETGNVLHAYQRVEPRVSTVELIDVSNGISSDESTLLEIPVRNINFRPPRGGQLAVTYEDGHIPVFNWETGETSSRLQTVSRPNVVGFSRNGAWFVAGSESGSVSVWNLSDHNRFSPTSHRGGVLALAFSPTDNKVATAGNDNTAMVNLSIAKQLFRIPDQPLVRDLAFSPDGSRLATASADRRIRIWDTTLGVEQLTMVQHGSVNEVVFSSRGQWLATTGDDRTVRVWDAVTGTEIFQIPLNASGSQLAFCNDDKWLVSTDASGAIQIWDISIMDLPSISRSTPSGGLIDHVQYSPSGERLAVGSENGLWLLTPDPETILRERDLNEPDRSFESKIKELTFSPDSTRLGVLTEGNEVAIYDVEGNTWHPLTVSSSVQEIGFSPDSGQVLISGADGSIQVWDVQSAEPLESPAQESVPVSSLATSSQFLAMGLTDTIQIIGGNGNGGISSIEAPGENVLLVFNENGSLLASADSTGAITLWQYQDGTFTAAASFDKERAVSLAFQPGGTILAIGTARYVYLVNTAGQELARIPHTDTVNGVSFSGDGKYLATASSTLLQVWELAKIDLVENDHLIGAACSRLFQNFSVSQWESFFRGEQYEPLCADLQTPE